MTLSLTQMGKLRHQQVKQLAQRQSVSGRARVWLWRLGVHSPQGWNLGDHSASLAQRIGQEVLNFYTEGQFMF